MLEHGGNLHDAIARFDFPRSEWLDLSTGLNPQSFAPPALPPEIWHRLPEPYPALGAAARAYYGAPQLLAVGGSQAAIQALPRLRPHSRVVIAAPSYAEHAYRWRQAGHQVREVPYAELDAAIDTCDVMVVCNPNNPTGARLASFIFLQWAERLAARQGWLVIDEAFADTTPEDSVVSHTQQSGLIVLRSLGKFFGLAGLRLGFVAANDLLLRQIADHVGPWGVSAAAQLIGCAALSDDIWHGNMRKQLLVDGQRLHALLAEYGIAAQGTALFQWWPEPEAERFAQHMAQQAIWVRRFNVGAHGIRLGLPHLENDWQRLRHALQTWTSRIAN